MTTKWRIKGNYEWTEERHYDCVAYIDAEVEADTKEKAVTAAIKEMDGDADEENKSYIDRSAWKRGSAQTLKAEIVSSDDAELLERTEKERNLAYMREFSTPLFDAQTP